MYSNCSISTIMNRQPRLLTQKLKGQVARAGCILKREIAVLRRADNGDIAVAFVGQGKCAGGYRAGIVEATRKDRALRRAREQCPRPIACCKNQLPPTKVNLAELRRRVAIVKACWRLRLPLTTQQSTWYLVSRLQSLLQRLRRQHLPCSLIKHHCNRRRRPHHINHNIDIVNSGLHKCQLGRIKINL